MNSWQFTGYLGQSADQKFVGDQSLVAFSVAVKSGFGEKAVTTWANCQMWGKRGESVLPYLKKGQLVGVSGEATLRTYEKKDGSNGVSLDVRVNDVTLLGKADSRPAAVSADNGNSVVDFSDDDIPF